MEALASVVNAIYHVGVLMEAMVEEAEAYISYRIPN